MEACGDRERRQSCLPGREEACRRDFEKDDPLKMGGRARQRRGNPSESLENKEEIQGVSWGSIQAELEEPNEDRIPVPDSWAVRAGRRMGDKW